MKGIDFIHRDGWHTACRRLRRLRHLPTPHLATPRDAVMALVRLMADPIAAAMAATWPETARP